MDATDSAGTLLLMAPMTGVLVPIEKVPDPVFAEKLVGDGISIDPLSESLVAPCDGEITHVHPAGHAVTMKLDGGLELMLHVGVDTVNLKGEGFTVCVQPGDTVTAGTEMIAFDADYVATNAKSLLTQVVITDMENVARLEPGTGSVSVGSDVVLRITPREKAAGAEAAEGHTVTSDAILIPNAEGLHARPSAVLANLAKRYASQIQIQCDELIGNAKSVTAIMKMNIAEQDKVVLIATGPDAQEAIDGIAPHLASGLGDTGHVPAPAPATVVLPERSAPARKRVSDDPDLLLGVSASPGLAVGRVMQVREQAIEVAPDADDPMAERQALAEAVEGAKGQIEAIHARLLADADADKAAIFAAHQELLEDPELVNVAESAIAKGRSAGFAWQQAYENTASDLEAMKNELLAQRANDLRDAGRRVLQVLLGIEIGPREYTEPCILVANDLTPSDTATLDRNMVRGFCTTLGGATSHVAILARSLGIPAVAGIDPGALDLPDGSEVVLDGGKGTLRRNPAPELLERIRRRQEEAEARRKADLESAHEPATTTDGTNYQVFANIGGLADAKQIADLGGEGVGLLRTEFLFMDRVSAPSEDEQADAYAAIVDALGADRTLIIRTLDVGGDKPLAYLPLPEEDNPFLGERGIRFVLDRPEILRTQLRAILRASTRGKVRVMFPMIATLDEWHDVKAVLDEEAQHLGVEPIPAGIMVEIPSTALQSEAFAREVDFFSIGTNDLTQYTLAMDRGHPKLAAQMDGLNPAVLTLIERTVAGARKHDREVGVCGGLASDLAAVPILLGLGVHELSVSLPAIPAVKALIRSRSAADCRALAERVLAADTTADVRAMSPDPFDDEAS